MVNQKNILLISISLLFINYVQAKPNYKKNSKKLELTTNNNSSREILKINNNNNKNILLSRNQNNYYLNNFDDGLDNWIINDGWNRSELDFYSEEYSINSFDILNGDSQLWQITTPVFALPADILNETLHFSFWLRNDMLDGDGNEDGFLDDFFSLSLLPSTSNLWISSYINSYDGRSYWCADEDLNGYGDSWVQFLDTPEIQLDSNSQLSAMLKWSIENTDGTEQENIEAICEDGSTIIDGWDQANVQISTDSGISWEILTGNHLYDFQCGYGTFYNGFVGQPGWSGNQDWHQVNFNLSSYSYESVIIRFAFYSDPSYSTVDDELLTGLQIDNITVKGESANILFQDNVDNPQMIGSGENWIEQIYDYWDDGVISGLGSPQPGSLFWEEYKPGTAFEGNILQDITQYSGEDIKFRFQSFFDGNNDGGIGSGLFIDDFRIYSETTEFYPPPTNINVKNSGQDIEITWSDLLNYSGEYLYTLDSQNDSFDETTLASCENDEDCTTFMGNLFYVHGNSSVDSVYIFNKNNQSVDVQIGAFSTVGSFFNPEPTFTKNVTLTESDNWNAFAVEDWNFTNPYIIAHTITDEISISLDTNSPPYGAFFDGSIWNSTETDESYYSTGIRAKITKESSNVTYNVFRLNDANDDFTQLASSLTDSIYIDTEVEELQNYVYGVSATYPENNNESIILVYPEAISILPSSYQEFKWDDGTFESAFELESNDSLAMKFRAEVDQPIVRFKWYQTENDGHLKLIIWDNNQNTNQPGDILYSKLLTTNYNPLAGWNEYDLNDEDWLVSGDFWVGIKAYSTTSPIGIDYDMGSSASIYKRNSTDWTSFNNWNFGMRIYLNCESDNIDDCGVCDGDNSSCIDCNGVPNGLSVIDDCGVCGGDNLLIDGCSCSIGPRDECGICGGSGPTEECGCNDIEEGSCDCLGTLPDDCGICFGNNSNKDICGVCNGDNSSCTGCMDSNYLEFDEDAIIPCNDCCSSTILSINENLISSSFDITNIYPNPFNPQLIVEYKINTAHNVKIDIYDLNGRLVENLFNSHQFPGDYSLSWNPKNLNSGIYLLQIISNAKSHNKKIVYLK